jgi:LasA protease
MLRKLCLLSCFCALLAVLLACTPQSKPVLESPDQQSRSDALPASESVPTPLPTRPIYAPGELVDYIAQAGDTLPALAAHFNTTEKEIRAANPVIPQNVTTLPAGLPMKIPIYYQPLWGSPYQIIPDSLFINGPAQRDFDPVAFVVSQPGWLKDYEFYAGGKNRRGGELVQYVAEYYSISPRLLLALIEYQAGGLSQPSLTEDLQQYPLGYHNRAHEGLYRQLLWAANTLNNGYYGWRTGRLNLFELADGSLERADPWQNAASVALHYYFAQFMSGEAYQQAVHANGLAKTYQTLFGSMWENNEPHIPGSLQQPLMQLPFAPGSSWAFTGGPHTGWGDGEPWAAIDFAPPAAAGGCNYTEELATAVADGTIVRKDTGVAVLDLDGDGDERTGWTVFYLHLETASIPPVGVHLKAGQPIGRPSCEGGRTTGTHVHIARKYNGEWIPADGALAFNLEGWIARNGKLPYEGSLVRFSQTVHACDCADSASQLQAGR